MSHELDMSNERANMAYVGETPWHGLGQELTEGASIEEWTKQAGLDWHVHRAPVRFAVPGAAEEEDVKEMGGRHVLYRGDTQAPLSVVSKDYKIAQPAQLMDFFSKIVEKTSAKMETAGSLYGGRVIWAMARLGENDDVLDDSVAPFLLLATSYDHSTPTIGKFCAERVVCKNTIQVALDEKNRKQVRIPHSTEFNADAVRAGLEIHFSAYEKFIADARKLAGIKFDEKGMDAYLLKLLTPAKGEVDQEVIRKSRAYKQVLDLFNGKQIGGNQEAVKDTAWGAVNAVTQFIDHVKGRNQDARLMDAWFLTGADFKERALATALDLTSV